MTSNFSQTTVSKSAKRVYTNPITTLANFTAAVAAFLADTTMNLTSKEKKSESYKAPVVFFDAAGDEKGQVYVTAPSSTVYTDATALLVADANLGEAIAGMGGEQSLDETDALWSAKISCELNGDTFSVNFNREYAVVSGYSEDATLAVLETWFDANETVA